MSDRDLTYAIALGVMTFTLWLWVIVAALRGMVA